MAPSFYKIILSSKKVRIPNAFVSQTKGSLATGAVVLRDRYRNLWQVEFSKNGQKFYFGNGWNHCFRGSRLKTGDLVTFEYAGGNLIKFEVYGRNGCGKEGAGGGMLVVRPDQEQRDYNLEEDEEELENEEIESLDESDFDYVTEGEDTNDDDDDDNNGYVEEEEEDEVNMNTRDRATSSNKRSRNSKETNTFCFRSETQRRIYGDDIFNSIPDCRPKIPYFISRSRSEKRLNDLHIPVTVLKDHKLDISPIIFLVDERDREWKAKVHNYNTWVRCSGGLKDLCDANNIKTNDICICELVEGEGSNMVSHIRVQSFVVEID